MTTLDQALAAIATGDTLTGLGMLFATPDSAADPRVAVNRALYAPVRNDSLRIADEQEHALDLLGKTPEGERATLLYNLGCYALFQDEIFQARMRFEDVLKLDPAHVAARHNLGFAHELMAEYAGAKAEYRRVLEQNPRFTLSRLSLGQLLLFEGSVAAGLAELRALLAADPGNMGAVLYLCRALLSSAGQGSGNGSATAGVKEALELLRRHPGYQRFPDLRECHAYAVFRLGDVAGAEAQFRALLAEDDHNLFARLGLMKALGAREAHEELRGHAERYHALNPTPESKALVDALRAL